MVSARGMSAEQLSGSVLHAVMGRGAYRVMSEGYLTHLIQTEDQGFPEEMASQVRLYFVLFIKDFIYLFLERGKGRRKRERNTDV